MNHDQLQEDLASYLRAGTDRMVWCNTQLGPVGSPRPDVFTVNKSFSKFRTDAYEIKVSVSDLRSDVTSGKWQSYRKFGHCVWFAFPRGMAPLNLIPKECGVILRGDAGWRAARKPVAQVLDTLPRDAWLKLLMDLHPINSSGHVKAPRQANDYKGAEIVRKRLGDKIGRLFSDVNNAEGSLQYRKDSLAADMVKIEEQKANHRKMLDAESERIVKALDDGMHALGVAIGLNHDDVTAATLLNAVNTLRYRIRGAGISRAIEQLQILQAALENPVISSADPMEMVA